MAKVIPILPCPDIRTQVRFYEQLGFEVTGLYTSPNPYASIRLGAIELHFWGSRKNVPAANSSMCFIQVEDVDAIYEGFVGKLKAAAGKIPRSGIPRISKVRDLTSDRRFTLTDPGGNTIFVAQPAETGAHSFFRTLESEEYARKFAIVYDIMYSKEDPELAASTLEKYKFDKAALGDLDKAKLLLLTLDIRKAAGRRPDDAELNGLINAQRNESAAWKKIEARLSGILQAD